MRSSPNPEDPTSPSSSPTSCESLVHLTSKLALSLSESLESPEVEAMSGDQVDIMLLDRLYQDRCKGGWPNVGSAPLNRGNRHVIHTTAGNSDRRPLNSDGVTDALMLSHGHPGGPQRDVDIGSQII